MCKHLLTRGACLVLALILAVSAALNAQPANPAKDKRLNPSPPQETVYEIPDGIELRKLTREESRQIRKAEREANRAEHWAGINCDRLCELFEADDLKGVAGHIRRCVENSDTTDALYLILLELESTDALEHHRLKLRRVAKRLLREDDQRGTRDRNQYLRGVVFEKCLNDASEAERCYRRAAKLEGRKLASINIDELPRENRRAAKRLEAILRKREEDRRSLPEPSEKLASPSASEAEGLVKESQVIPNITEILKQLSEGE